MTEFHAPTRRRTLRFNDLSEVMPEVERLRRSHRTTGRWTLAQVCRHLADSFNGSIDGFGVRNHRVMRWLFGRRALQQVFAGETLGRGFTVTKNLDPPETCDENDCVEALAQAIQRFTDTSGPLHFHPFFGDLTRPEWDRLHRIHCAHHLSFVVPCAD
jgi:hypothetical protein